MVCVRLKYQFEGNGLVAAYLGLVFLLIVGFEPITAKFFGV